MPGVTAQETNSGFEVYEAIINFLEVQGMNRSARVLKHELRTVKEYVRDKDKERVLMGI